MRQIAITVAVAAWAAAGSAADGHGGLADALAGWVARALESPAVVSVADFGAVGDGTTDSTRAFREAIAAATRGEPMGATVVVPPGRYVLTDTLELRRCLLMGLAAGGWPADACPMPELEVRHSKGPAIIARDAASVHGLSFNYGHGRDGPVPYPPTILLAGNGISITNVRIHAAYDGIIADGRSNIGRLNIENVFMPQLYHCGVYITRTYDIATVRNVEVWVPHKWNISHGGVGFRLGRNDGVRLTNCFAFNCGIGYLFDVDEKEGGGAAWAEMNQCGTDACSLGIVVRAPAFLNINGGQYLDHFETIRVEDGGAQVAVSGAMMQSNGAPAVVVEAARTVTLTGCHFKRAFVNNKRYLVEISGGEAVALSGCVFSDQAPGVKVGGGAGRVAIAGNVFLTPEDQPAVTVDERVRDVVGVWGNVYRPAADTGGNASSKQ